MLHSVLHSWGVLSDPVQLPQAFQGQILLHSTLSLGSSCLSRGGGFHQRKAGANEERIGPAASFLAGMNCTWSATLIAAESVRPSLIKSSPPQLWRDFYLFPCQQYLVILMAFLVWANMTFNLFDFGNSFSYTRNNPVTFANQNYPSFAPSLHSEKNELSAQTPVCSFAAGLPSATATKSRLTYSSVNSESLVPGTCCLSPKMMSHGQREIKRARTSRRSPVPSSLLSSGTVTILIWSKV